MRRSNYTTLLLVLIVIILLFGVGIAIYYVLDLDWFAKKAAQMVDIYDETQKNDVQVKKEIAYDLAKRIYNIKLSTENLDVIVYKDGTVGMTITDSKTNEQVNIYKENLNKEKKMELTNIIRAYEVEASNGKVAKKYIVLLDVDGTLYKQEKEAIITSGNFAFAKIEGLAKIIDVRQITNDELTENNTGINAIAIDGESNELLLTNYLLTEK